MASSTKQKMVRDRQDSGCFFDSDDCCGSDERSWPDVVAAWSMKAHSVVEQEVARMAADTHKRRKERAECVRRGGDVAEVEER